MKVKELKKILEQYNDDDCVVLTSKNDDGSKYISKCFFQKAEDNSEFVLDILPKVNITDNMSHKEWLTMINFIVMSDQFTKGRFTCMNSKERLQYIFDTEEGIDVPLMRQKDYNWLLRNFNIRNRNHPLAKYVTNLIIQILR